MDLGHGLGHLTYSTLVHAGDTWEEMRASLEEFVPGVKSRVSPDQPFGVSLRISADSARTLMGSRAERTSLTDFLTAHDLYVYTVNAFPYGPFKGDSVMERVYEPDWGSQDRVTYTTAVAEILAEISAEGVSPSIQTSPLAFRPRVTGDAYVEAFTTNLLRVVAHLVELEARTGRRVKLALEPEPACFLETTDETVSYFTERLYTARGVGELARLIGRPMSEAEGLLRRHLGVVFDIGHQSVGFEDIPTSLSALVDAGIPIFKLQEAAALWVKELTLDVSPPAEDVHRHDLPQPDHDASCRRDHEVPQPRRRAGRVRARCAAGRDSHPLPRAGLPRGAGAVPARLASRCRRRSRCIARRRCPTTWRSRPTRGTSFRNTSRPATSPTTSPASWSSSVASSRAEAPMNRPTIERHAHG